MILIDIPVMEYNIKFKYTSRNTSIMYPYDSPGHTGVQKYFFFFFFKEYKLILFTHGHLQRNKKNYQLNFFYLYIYIRLLETIDGFYLLKQKP